LFLPPTIMSLISCFSLLWWLSQLMTILCLTCLWFGLF
jgi:hypothetical protein